MSIAIYRPYFYIIQHINSSKYYAGVKYAENADPDQLLKPNGYQTSSNIIKQIILEEGLESFVIRKIRVFETAEQALAYELRFLRRVNAAFNDSFLNRSNNSINTLNIDWEKIKKTNLKRYGVEYTHQSEEIRNKTKQTMLLNHGVENPNQVPEFQEKRKQTCLRKYGYEYSCQNEDIKEKTKQTNLEKYGVEHIMQSPETKEKYKQTLLRNFGVEHFSHLSQIPEIQEKKRQTRVRMMNRPIVLEIRKYKEKFNPKLIHYWFCKSEEILDGILSDLRITYGEL